MLVFAAVGLTAGGFFLGRRLSKTQPAPASASPTPAASSRLAPPTADPAEPPRLELDRSGDETGVPNPPAPSAAPGAPAARPPAGAPRVRSPRRTSPPAAPGPPAAPAVPESGPAHAVPDPPVGRGFAAGLTRIGSTRSSGATLKGFEPDAVALKRAPRSEGSIEFEVTPSPLRPGQPYAVKVYLRNHGEKPIEVRTLTVASEFNGHRSRSTLSPRSKHVAPSLVGLLAELPGVWKDGVTSWSVEVDVLTSAGDTYSNRVAWK
jgi:hypothetical protein